MPYYITDKQSDCNGWATAKLENGKLITVGCHITKQDAVDQMVAVSLSEGLEPMGEYTRDLNGEPIVISDIDDTLITDGARVDRVYKFLEEQEGELYLVTGRPVSTQAETVAELEALGIDFDRLIMNTGSSADSNAFKKATAEELLKTYNVTLAVENNPDARAGYAELGIEVIDPADIPEQPTDMPQKMDSQRAKWLRSAWAIKSKLEGGEVRSFGKNEIRTNISNIEFRAEGDNMTFSGYAAVFNTDSVPLPFIERIAPGAFKRSISERTNEIKMLWNHDPSQPLASKRAGTLRLQEDAKGLFVEARLANTSTGRDVAELIRTGVVDSMSFGFNVIDESWSQDGQVRTLENVRLFEISAVSFPAYPSTAGTVSVRSIDADKLADSLLALENGESLAAEQASLIKEIADKLSNDPDVKAVNGNLLDLKKKLLDLKLKELDNGI